jgi:hypothetical protein
MTSINITRGESGGARIDFTIPSAVRVLATLAIFEDASGAVRQTLRIAPTSYSVGECINFLVQAVIDCIQKHSKERVNRFITQVGFTES